MRALRAGVEATQGDHGREGFSELTFTCDVEVGVDASHHLANVGDARRRFAPELAVIRQIQFVRARDVELWIECRRRSAGGGDERAQLLRTVIQTVPIRIEKAIRA